MKRRLLAILVATFLFTLVFACVAGAQETTLESDDGATLGLQDGTDQQPLVFAEGEQTVQAQAEAEPTTPEPEPQDDEKGPLAGGTAIGKDVLVPGDVIRTLPDGTVVFGIDQIVIETEDCELTAEGDELTITLSDRGVPFRLRDGDNVDITLEEDGTIVANGRETLGNSFPAEVKDNPTQVIVPIPVDPENDDFQTGPNDTFSIISSTGIEGEGCRVVGQSEDPDDDDGGNYNGGNDNGGNNNSNNNRHHNNRHHTTTATMTGTVTTTDSSHAGSSHAGPPISSTRGSSRKRSSRRPSPTRAGSPLPAGCR